MSTGAPHVLRGLTADKKGWARIDEKYSDVSIRSVGVYHDDKRGVGARPRHRLHLRGRRPAHRPPGRPRPHADDDQLAAIGSVDVLLVPVGGVTTLDAYQATRVIDQLHPRLMIVPMHYKTEALDLVPRAQGQRPSRDEPGRDLDLRQGPAGDGDRGAALPVTAHRPRARATRCQRPMKTRTGSANAASSATIASATTSRSDQWPLIAPPAPTVDRDRRSWRLRAWALKTKSQRSPRIGIEPPRRRPPGSASCAPAVPWGRAAARPTRPDRAPAPSRADRPGPAAPAPGSDPGTGRRASAPASRRRRGPDPDRHPPAETGGDRAESPSKGTPQSGASPASDDGCARGGQAERARDVVAARDDHLDRLLRAPGRRAGSGSWG